VGEEERKMSTMSTKKAGRRAAFTLVELLVVISIIGVLAALLLPLAGSVTRVKKINTAQAELQQLETALENYKAKYGVYPPAGSNAMINPLYYELSGVTNVVTGSTTNYQTLDSSSTVLSTEYIKQFSVGGVVNSSQGTGDEMAYAKDFLPGLKPTEVVLATNGDGSGTIFAYLVTSVGGPDADYQPLTGSTGNPFRYAYPGTNNPSSYDLWVQLSINSGFSGVNVFTHSNTYLICNWSQQALHNSPQP
jgi:prepilin-type N-terminal cleavage/methylation domain-containing protein